MQIVAELLGALFGFLEQEARAAKRGLMGLAAALGLLGFALIVLLTTFGLVVWGLYVVLSRATGPAGGVFITAGITLVLGVLLLLIAFLSANRRS